METTGFSIELLEDGFRVIDPATLVRYVVRRAPDATPLSTPSTPIAQSTAKPVGASDGAAPPEPPKTASVGSSRTPSTAPPAVSAAGAASPSASAPAADMSGMTQAERIAAMLSVDPAPSPSRAPHAPSGAPKSGAPKSGSPKSSPRSVPAASGRNGGQPSRPSGSPDGATPSASPVALRAPQGAALRAPRAAAIAVPESPLSSPAPSAVPEPPAAEAVVVEPARAVQVVVPAAPEANPAIIQPPPPRMITQPPTAPVVQSLTELQALVRPSAPPRPVSQPPPAPAAHAAPPEATNAAQSSPPAIVAHAPQASVADAPLASSALAPPSSPPESLPLAELLFQRSEDPSAASPLTYREAAWAVPEGTSIGSAVRLLAGMFEGVRAALAGLKPGKLVYMAIFDHHFVGKPTRPPLATLTWKDWKDQGQGPEIRRQGEPRTSFQPPPMSNSFIPAAVPQPPTAMPQVQAPAPSAAPPPAAVEAAAPTAVSAPPPPAVVVIAQEALPMAPPAVQAPAVVRAEPALPEAPVQAAAQVLPAAPAAAHKLVVVPEPVTPLPIMTPEVAPAPASASPPAVRLSGVELIADLFECMHDLHFLPDALAGADFVLRLMLDKLPSAVALVHFYDIDAREFVVMRAVGAGAAKVMQIRTNEKEPLIAEAMHKRRAVVLDDATADPRAQNGRWALIGEPPRSLVCAPVEEGGRFLGLLELSNPLDGQPFSEGDGHAITYIGEQFAEFLAARSIVLDPERIGD
ncbi:MAG TPA: GAF domain-containing protein [Polyangiaceae bacterium]|nr:GAF domain-containing protein [Polyangiaceae bacterium]